LLEHFKLWRHLCLLHKQSLVFSGPRDYAVVTKLANFTMLLSTFFHYELVNALSLKMVLSAVRATQPISKMMRHFALITPQQDALLNQLERREPFWHQNESPSECRAKVAW
jgi:hypothetical protein